MKARQVINFPQIKTKSIKNKTMLELVYFFFLNLLIFKNAVHVYSFQKTRTVFKH